MITPSNINKVIEKNIRFPKDLLEAFNDEILIHCGLTEISMSKLQNTIIIKHAGNMGSTIDHVKRNVDKALGSGWFNKLKNIGKVISEKGNPDCYYELLIQF